MKAKKQPTTATLGEIAKAHAKQVVGAPAVLRVVIPGEPCPKERARTYSKKLRDGRVITRSVTPDKTRAYESKVKTLVQIAVNQQRWAWSDKDAFSVTIAIYRTFWDSGGDASNIFKACEDAMIRVAYPNDHLVRGIGIGLQERDPINPRVEIVVRRYLHPRYAKKSAA